MSSKEKETAKSRETKQPPTYKDGKIPIKDLFNKIYAKVDSAEMRRVAPEELKTLKYNLDSALAQIESMNRKMQRKDQGPQ